MLTGEPTFVDETQIICITDLQKLNYLAVRIYQVVTNDIDSCVCQSFVLYVLLDMLTLC